MIITTLVSANTKKADRSFERWDYYRAAQLYEKEANKNPSADVYFKLGESYRMMNSYKNLEQAADDKVNSYGPYSNPIFYLNYGQVLKSNGKNAEAKIAFDKYAQLMPQDPRGKFYSESIDKVSVDHLSDNPITVTNVSSLNTANADFAPVKYKDGIVFSTTRPTSGHSKIYKWTNANYLDIYSAKATKDKLQFNNIEPFAGNKNNKKYHDGPACFSANYDTIYISRVDKSLKGKSKKSIGIEKNAIFSSTLKDGEWTAPKAFTYNNDTFSVANPFITKDGSRIYFVSDMLYGYGRADIYYCNKIGNDWGRPINMGSNINTFGGEKFPMVDSLGNFYFSSDGYQGIGGMDICISKNNNGYFEKAIPMKTPINSTDDDYGILFSQAERAGYISSNRKIGSKGDADIYYFNFNKDNVDSNLLASNYTIGYLKPAPKTILAIVPVKDDGLEPPVFHATVMVQHFIYFDYDKSDLRAKSISYLDSIVVFLKESPDTKLIMGGHTDQRGSAEYNMKLSLRRTNSTSQYLISQGIAKNRIDATGYGLQQMVNKCTLGVFCTESEHQLNRRVEFYFE